MRLRHVTGALLFAVALPAANAQSRVGPTFAAGVAGGRQLEPEYSTTSWSGFHVALTLPCSGRGKEPQFWTSRGTVSGTATETTV